MESPDRPLDRVLRAKRDREWESPISGVELMVFGVQLTILGGFVDGLGVLLFVGASFSVLGLLVR